MRNIIICSICSRKKDRRKSNLRARYRYLGSHIAKVMRHATEEELPFFILSGVYGFVSADEPVPYYDHLLVADEVNALVIKLLGQMRHHRVEEIRFYTKAKANWAPYLAALKEAGKELGILVSVEIMRDDD